MIIRVPRVDELEKKSHRYIGLMSVLPHLSDYRDFSVNHTLGLTTTVYDSVNWTWFINSLYLFSHQIAIAFRLGNTCKNLAYYQIYVKPSANHRLFFFIEIKHHDDVILPKRNIIWKHREEWKIMAISRNC